MRIHRAIIRTESGRKVAVWDDGGVYRFLVGGPLTPDMLMKILEAVTQALERSGDPPAGKPPTEELWRLLDTRIDERLELSVRAANRLQNRGLIYIGEIVGCSEEELLQIKGMGKISVGDIRTELKRIHPYLDVPRYGSRHGRRRERIIVTDGWMRPDKRAK